MKACIECGAESVPEQVIDGVQVYECTNKHRWGIIDAAREAQIRAEVEKNRPEFLKVA